MFLVTFLQIEWRTQDCPHKKYVICLVCFNKCFAPVILNITPALCCLFPVDCIIEISSASLGRLGMGWSSLYSPQRRQGGLAFLSFQGGVRQGMRGIAHALNLSIKMSQICQISLLPLPTKDRPPPRRHLTQAF